MTRPFDFPLRRRALLQRGSAPFAAVLGAGGLSNLLAAGPARASDYKALVCIFLYGGNDGLNMVVPNDESRHARYAAVRGGLALPRASLLHLDGIDFGLHPAMAALRRVWARGALAPVFNVGPLRSPLTKAQYLAALARRRAGDDATDVLPDGLFSHADQQTLWDTATPDATTPAGWGGRAAESFSRGGSDFHPVISVAGTSRFGSSSQQAPLVVPGPGADFYAHGLRASDTGPAQQARRTAVQALYAPRPGAAPVLAEVYAAMQREALAASPSLADLVKATPGGSGANATIDAAFAPLTRNGQVAPGLASQLYQLAKLIAAREMAGGPRQVFFASQGGYDTHRDQVVSGNPAMGLHATLLKELADGLAAFLTALEGIGMSRAVTTFTQNEFGRTFVPNRSGGTDHGWGNQQLVMGGAVNGGHAYGSYPDLELGGDQDADDLERSGAGLGRWIPTTSVDQYAATLLGWMGSSDAQLDAVLPNLHRFGPVRRLGFV